MKNLVSSEQNKKEITVQQLHEATTLGQGSFAVIDVRTPEEYLSGAIPTAKNIPLDNLAQQAKQLREYDRVYLVCRSGGRSLLAQVQLELLGLGNSINVKGGTSAWVEAGYEVKK